MADYIVTGRPGDTVFLVTAQNEQARANLEENVSEESQWLGVGLAVEHRYIADLIEQLREEGWTVEVEG